MLLLLVACGDGEEAAPIVPLSDASRQTGSPSSADNKTPEPTPPPALTPLTSGRPSGLVDEFRSLAVEVQAAVESGNGALFAERGIEQEMLCTGDEQLEQCAGQPLGTVVRGVPGVAWQSDAAALIPRDEFAQTLNEWFAGAMPDASDRYGSGAARLYAIAENQASSEIFAILAAIEDSGPAAGIQRQARVMRFARVDGQWQLNGEIFAAVEHTAADWLNPSCAQCYDYWEPWEGATQ